MYDVNAQGVNERISDKCTLLLLLLKSESPIYNQVWQERSESAR